MKLTLRERLTILQILPVEGNIATVRILKELKQKLGISEDEFTSLNIKVEEVNGATSITWDEVNEVPAEMVIGNKQKEIISKSLEKLDSEGKLNESHLTLYDKFVI